MIPLFGTAKYLPFTIFKLVPLQSYDCHYDSDSSRAKTYIKKLLTLATEYVSGAFNMQWIDAMCQRCMIFGAP